MPRSPEAGQLRIDNPSQLPAQDKSHESEINGQLEKHMESVRMSDRNHVIGGDEDGPGGNHVQARPAGLFVVGPWWAFRQRGQETFGPRSWIDLTVARGGALTKRWVVPGKAIETVSSEGPRTSHVE